MDDFRQALRGLRRRGRPSAAIVGTLGLALAAALATAAVVDAVLLRPLPFEAADRIVALWNTGRTLPAGVRAVSLQDLDDWRADARTLQAVSAHTPVSATLTQRGDPRRIEGARVARDFDAVLGIHPELGRLFNETDFAGAGSDALVLTHAFWRREFGGAPDVIGQVVVLDGASRTIVGVLPDLAMPYPTEPHDFWVPLVARRGAPWESNRGTGWIMAIARMRATATTADVRGELTSIAGVLAERFPQSNASREAVEVRALHDDVVFRSRPALLLVAAAVAALLLVAFGNVVHLLVARAAGRRVEFAMRHALGGTPFRVARQAAFESLTLALAAVALGLALAPALLDLLLALPASVVPREREIAMAPIAWRWGAALLAVTAAVLAWPTIMLARRSFLTGAESARVTGHRERSIRHALVASQVGLSIVLLLAGVAFVRTLQALESVDLGFSSEQVLTMSVTPSQTAAPSPAATMLFYERVLDEVGAMPGVAAVSAATSVPFVVYGWSFSVATRETPDARQLVHVTVASDRHFDALQVPVVRGRRMTDDEHRGGADVVVVSRTLARALFGDEEAVGRELDYSGRRWLIVGEVADLRRGSLAEGRVAEVYLPWHNAGPRPQAVVVRATGEPHDLIDTVTRRIRAIDPAATVSGAAPLHDKVSATLAPHRFRAALLSGLALLAAFLAVFGVYSVTSWSVTTREREQAIRNALGERTAQAQRRLVFDVLRPAVVGLVSGLGAAWYASRFAETLLFEVSARDASLLVPVSLGVMAVTALAAWWPAFASAGRDPAQVLRGGGELRQ